MPQKDIPGPGSEAAAVCRSHENGSGRHRDSLPLAVILFIRTDIGINTFVVS